jgi:hypothetical protein
MDEILNHPFFWTDEDLAADKQKQDLVNQIEALQVKLHKQQGTDVVFSYQSNEVMEMKRVSRVLNFFNLTTLDGTMVLMPLRRSNLLIIWCFRSRQEMTGG